MNRPVTRALAAFASAAAISLAVPALAQSPAPAAMNSAMNIGTDKARFSDVRAYNGTPDLALTVSLVDAGGGPKAFDTTKLLGVLAGAKTEAEVAKLTKQFGASGVQSFIKTFDFVINDSLRIVIAKKVALPSTPQPPANDGKALAAALYKEGITPSGTFDVEYMLDHLVTHPVHVQVMDDIDANSSFGARADANYHVVLLQAMKDLKAVYNL